VTVGTRWAKVGASILALIAASASAAPLSGQANAYRFEIVAATDSTMTFSIGHETWVKRGLRGIAVDPRRHDALVAQFEVSSVNGGMASAVVTGQTGPVTTEQLALLERPKPPWYADRRFWFGVGAGAVVGAAIGIAATH